MKKAATWLAVALAVVLVAPPMAAHAARGAERQREIQQEISRLREELDEVAAEEAEVVAELRVTQRRKTAEESRLAELDAQMAAAIAQLQSAQASLDGAVAAELRARQRLEEAQAKLEEAHDRFRDQVVSAYVHDNRLQVPVLPRDPDEIAELGTARVLIKALNEQQAELIDRFKALQKDTEALEREAQVARNEAAAQRDTVAARHAELEVARRQQATATAAATAEADHERTLLESLRGTRKQYERRIREQQVESEAIAALLRRRGSDGPVISGKGSLGAPLARPVVTSMFGYRTHPIFGDRRLHTGLDFRAATGTPLLAVRAGEVIYAGWRSGYGNTTILDHGGGLATLYAHQSEIFVAVGDVVARGDRIGAAGATGFATGPHLHFEVRRGGAPVDPLIYL